MQSWCTFTQNSRKDLYSYCFVTSLGLFIFKKWCKCSFKKIISNIFSCLPSWRSLTKIAGSWSVKQRYGSPDPDQIVTDPQHCSEHLSRCDDDSVLVKAEELPVAPSPLPPEKLESDGLRIEYRPVTALHTKEKRSVLIQQRLLCFLVSSVD